ncbi:MAG: Glutamine--fructose-6-phosphate aminotransferase (isomerizing) [Methanomassiliicoccales archaeon PtaU1.Bin124]|nr:MAG: Glutamine--fructose-6-phosphate aminotransferase (isomerizing) [Methanomassiliicoccales archaeon PtaU1.Bin124]
MCGIIGYTGYRQAAEVLIEALRRLEYRGYDSAGVAILSPSLKIHKKKGELHQLQSSLPHIDGRVGVGHTRWATCGKPSNENAHPFLDCSGKIALVHNGIIENYMALKEGLQEEGHKFSSQTDTEVIVHLIEKFYQGDLHEAVKSALKEIKGTYAIAAVVQGSDEIVAARKENPLVIGVGVNENFVASDVTALLSYTNKVRHVMDGETVLVRPEGVRVFDSEGREVHREDTIITWSAEDAQKGGFPHFMLKEIFEEPQAIHNSLLGTLDIIENGEIVPNVQFSSIKIIACGSSYHAAMVGKYILEELGKIPVTLELASEYRYSPGAKEFPLVILISQSGETADTLAAAREARRRGCRTMGITNVIGSTLTREVDEVVYTRAGPEIGVAATKTFLTQLIALYIISIRIGFARRVLSHDAMWKALSELRKMPGVVQAVLDNAAEVEKTVELLVPARDIFFIGRNVNYPTMLEGALKLKEISYIHAEGFAAGELKHGPLALLDATTPVIAVAMRTDHTYEKMLANISEVAARESPVLSIGCDGDRELAAVSVNMIKVPCVSPLFSPIPVTVVLQLIAYYTAQKKGRSIDKPKNLAKSVTVE